MQVDYTKNKHIDTKSTQNRPRQDTLSSHTDDASGQMQEEDMQQYDLTMACSRNCPHVLSLIWTISTMKELLLCLASWLAGFPAQKPGILNKEPSTEQTLDRPGQCPWERPKEIRGR